MDIPEWAVPLLNDVASQGATLIALKGDINRIEVKLDAHCKEKNGSLKAMLALGAGIGAGLGGVGGGLLKLLG